MSANKRPRKQYKPRHASTSGGLTAIAMCHARFENNSPLRGDQLTDLGVAYWVSLEQLRVGDASEDHWSCVVCALNISLIMAENGIGAEYERDIAKALDGAFRAKIRSAKSGNFRLDGDAMRDITNVIAIHDEQMKLASRNEVVAALATVRRRIDEGNVYERQAA